MVEQTIYASKISNFLFCGHAYSLDTQMRQDELPLSGFMAQRFWLQNAFRKLFPDEPYVGDDLIHIESVEPDKLPEYLKYHSPEAFAKAYYGLWIRHVIQNNGRENKGRVHDRDVVWAYKKHWWKAAHQIRKACYNYYQHLIDEGLPILDFNDREVAFLFEGRKYVVRLPGIRRGMIVSEQNTKKKTQKELDNDWKITLQLLAFCTLAHDVEPYRMKWGVNPELAETWGNNEMYIDPGVKYVYYDLLRDERYETTRNDDDIETMIQETDRIQESIENEEFTPNHRSCSVCGYNVLGEDENPICTERNPKAKLLRPRSYFEEELQN